MLKPMTDFALIAHEVRGDLSKFAPSMTRQEFAEECDINTLMARYEAGGAISHVNKAQPVYMDVTAFPDLREALDYMSAASMAFNALPAKVRREFDHDAQKFVDYAQNSENIERMREWGLAAPPAVEPPPMRVEVVGGLQGATETPPEPPAKPAGKK